MSLKDVLATSITASKLYEFHETYRNDPDILCVEKVLTNLIDAEFKMSFDEMNEYIGIVVREKTPPNLKWALLTESPNSTMFSMLLMEEPHFKNKVGVFSTIKGACNYLEIKFDEAGFDESGYSEME